MKINIDGKTVETRQGLTILQAAEEAGVHIPTLCYLKEIHCISVCRVCMVLADGKLVPACSTLVRENMEIITDSQEVRAARRNNLELICSNHHMDCADCRRGADCELRALCKEYEVDDRAYGLGKRQAMVDGSSPYLVRDNAKCILCRRCEAVCTKLQGVNAIAANKKGGATNIGFGLPLAETECVGCGQCVAVCPTGALMPKDDTKKAWKAIFDKDIYVVAAVSPSAYERIGELFGEAPGTSCGEKMAEILRKIGFDGVVDMARVERFEMSKAAWRREKQSEAVFSGACPAWRRYVEQFHPELYAQILAPVPWRSKLVNAYRDKAGGKNAFVVEITNCVAKKGENGQADVVLSTREAFEMIQRACVSSFTADKIWRGLKGEAFDELPWEFEVSDADQEVYTVYGLTEAEEALKTLGSGKRVRVFACPGGCLNGGGMPRRHL